MVHEDHYHHESWSVVTEGDSQQHVTSQWLLMDTFSIEEQTYINFSLFWPIYSICSEQPYLNFSLPTGGAGVRTQ